MRLYILFNTFLVMLGCLLRWIQPSLFVAGLQGTVPLRGIDMFDGKGVFVLALTGFLTVSYQLLWKRKGSDWLYGGIGFAILVITGLVLYDYYQNRYPIGPGIYLSLLGGLQLTGSYVVVLIKQGRRSPPPSHPL